MSSDSINSLTTISRKTLNRNVKIENIDNLPLPNSLKDECYEHVTIDRHGKNASTVRPCPCSSFDSERFENWWNTPDTYDEYCRDALPSDADWLQSPTGFVNPLRFCRESGLGRVHEWIYRYLHYRTEYGWFHVSVHVDRLRRFVDVVEDVVVLPYWCVTFDGYDDMNSKKRMIVVARDSNGFENILKKKMMCGSFFNVKIRDVHHFMNVIAYVSRPSSWCGSFWDTRPEIEENGESFWDTRPDVEENRGSFCDTPSDVEENGESFCDTPSDVEEDCRCGRPEIEENGESFCDTPSDVEEDCRCGRPDVEERFESFACRRPEIGKNRGWFWCRPSNVEKNLFIANPVVFHAKFWMNLLVPNRHVEILTKSGDGSLSASEELDFRNCVVRFDPNDLCIGDPVSDKKYVSSGNPFVYWLDGKILKVFKHKKCPLDKKKFIEWCISREMNTLLNLNGDSLVK